MTFDPYLDADDAPALIHHGTSWPAAIAILRQDRLKVRRASDIEAPGVSLTGMAKVAADFARRRDDREDFVITLKAKGYSRHRINSWLETPGALTPCGTIGVTLSFHGPALAEAYALKAHSHYGMDEGEWRCADDIKDISALLASITLDAADAAIWATRLPKQTAAFAALAARAATLSLRSAA